MSLKHDEETFLDDILNIITSNLENKVIEINNDKNDDITLETIASNRFIETLNEEALNWPAFIYYGINNISSSSVGPVSSFEVSIFFDVLFMDDQSSFGNKARRSVQRYTRALREIIFENFKKLSYASQLEVESISPVNLRDIEDTSYYKVAGVQLRATIG